MTVGGEEVSAQCMREMDESKVSVTKEIDSVILAECRRVKEENLCTDERVEILKVIAKITQARASL